MQNEHGEVVRGAIMKSRWAESGLTGARCWKRKGRTGEGTAVRGRRPASPWPEGQRPSDERGCPSRTARPPPSLRASPGARRLAGRRRCFASLCQKWTVIGKKDPTPDTFAFEMAPTTWPRNPGDASSGATRAAGSGCPREPPRGSPGRPPTHRLGARGLGEGPAVHARHARATLILGVSSVKARFASNCRKEMRQQKKVKHRTFLKKCIDGRI